MEKNNKRNLGCSRCAYLTQNLNMFHCIHDSALITEHNPLTGELICTNAIHPFKKNVDCLCQDYTPKQTKLSLVPKEDV